MIDKIKYTSVNSSVSPQLGSDKQASGNGGSKFAPKYQQSFGGPTEMLLQGVQYLEKYPMAHVTALDLASAILPRTYVETYVGCEKTDKDGNKYKDPNYHAGVEAFRRESSGLIVNCLIPGFIAMGVAWLASGPIMGAFKKSSLSGTWADNNSLDKIKSHYEKADGTGQEKYKNVIKKMLNNIEGVDGKGVRDFETILKGDNKLDGLIDKLATSITQKKHDSELVDDVFNHIVGKTQSAELIKFKGDKELFTSNLDSLLTNTTKVLRGVEHAGIKNSTELTDFFTRAGKLVKVKSIGALVIVLPLAVAMQPINRWLTRKSSGKKGAPIYNDFKDRKYHEPTKAEKADLLKQKFISIGAMIGVSLLSMMKIPGMKMLEFKSKFPTMDQARIVSTATFSSRMAASEDANELREATLRDIATFSSFYFLGDYVAKAIATGITKYKAGANLLNYTKELKAGANPLEKFLHWWKDTHLKSSAELGANVTNKAKNVTKKLDLGNNINLRTYCQLGSLGFSLLMLGVLIPWYYRSQTNKKEQAKKAAQAA